MNTYGTTISTKLIRKNTEADWPHFEWDITLTREDRSMTLPYKTGLGHAQTKCGQPKPLSRYGAMSCQHTRCHNAGWQPTPPDLYGVLTSLKADSTRGESFIDWCADFGLDTDSIRARDTYFDFQQREMECRKFFGSDWTKLLDDEDYE